MTYQRDSGGKTAVGAHATTPLPQPTPSDADDAHTGAQVWRASPTLGSHSTVNESGEFAAVPISAARLQTEPSVETPKATDERDESPPAVDAAARGPSVVGADEDAKLIAVEVSVPSTTARPCDAVHVEGDEGRGVVYFLDGKVAWAVTQRSDMAIRGLRPRLIEAGHLTAPEFDMLVSLCRTDARNFCELLVSLALVERDDLRDVMQATLHDHLQALVSMTNVRVSWKRTTTTFTGNLTLSLDELLAPDDAKRWRRLVAPSHHGSPLRRHTETCIELRRSVEVETVRGSMTMTTVELSDAGARLHAAEMLPVASRVTVRLNVAGQDLVLTGRVARFERSTKERCPSLLIVWTGVPEAAGEAFARIFAAAV